MKFKTFCEKRLAGTNNSEQFETCFYNMYNNFLTDINTFSNAYHVIIHKTAFESFYNSLDETDIILNVSPLFKEDHMHLFAYSIKKLKSCQKIQITAIENKTHMRCIYNNCFSWEKVHHFVCNFTLNFHSLKDMNIKIILKRLPYLHKMKDLNLPKPLQQELFQHNKFHFYLPEYYIKTYEINYNHFSQVDHVHDKDFVVWFQNDLNLNMKYSFIVMFNFVFLDNIHNKINMCLKCINFEMKNSSSYIRRYLLHYPPNIFDFSIIQNPLNWCHGCKQVPLFQMLTQSQLVKQYQLKRKSLYRYGGREIDDCVIKIDYFKNGNKINSKTKIDLSEALS